MQIYAALTFNQRQFVNLGMTRGHVVPFTGPGLLAAPEVHFLGVSNALDSTRTSSNSIGTMPVIIRV